MFDLGLHTSTDCIRIQINKNLVHALVIMNNNILQQKKERERETETERSNETDRQTDR